MGQKDTIKRAQMQIKLVLICFVEREYFRWVKQKIFVWFLKIFVKENYVNWAVTYAPPLQNALFIGVLRASDYRITAQIWTPPSEELDYFIFYDYI